LLRGEEVFVFLIIFGATKDLGDGYKLQEKIIVIAKSQIIEIRFSLDLITYF
jgi:hypothetical protein